MAWEQQFASRPDYWMVFDLIVLSQDVNANTSTVQWAIAITEKSENGSRSADPSSWAFWVNGAQWGGASFTYDFRNYNYLPLFTGNAVVPHNSDGTMTLTIGSTISASGPLGYVTATVSMALPQIARATLPSFAPNPADAGSPLTISLPRASAGFTHDLIFAFGGLAAQPIAADVGAAHVWTPPMSLLERIPNAVSGQLQIGATTKSGGSTIGYKQVNGVLRAPDSVVPTVSAINHSDNNPQVASVVGKYVQGLSRLLATVDGQGIYGSTIASSQLVVDGYTLPNGDPLLLTKSGSVSIEGRVVDSRGRQASLAGTVDVLPYQVPTLSNVQVRRANASGSPADDGTYLRVDLTASVASLMNGTERNTLTITVYTRPRGGSAWTTRNVISPSGIMYSDGFAVTGGGVFSPTSSWDVRVRVDDAFGSVISDTTIATASVTLDLNNKAVGVGKLHERGALDVGGDTYVTGEIYHHGGSVLEPVGSVVAYAGSAAPSGWLICNGQAVSRSTYAALFAVLGTSYGAGDGSSTFNLPDVRGRSIFGVNAADSDFSARGKTGGAKTHTLTVAEMPPHDHRQRHNATDFAPGSGQAIAGMTSQGFGSTPGSNANQLTAASGGGAAHNNMPPFVTLNVIIKAL
jgi:microcystin-dependent protein